MATKTGGGNLLVDKGEKIGLGIAAVIGVGLLVLGLMSAVDRPQDPTEFAGKLDDKAKQLNAAMNSDKAEIPPLVGPVNDKAVDTQIVSLPNRHPLYDPTTPPDTRRITPVILTLAEGQVDMAVVKILANDFQFERDPTTQEIIKIRVGVVGAKDPEKKIDPEQYKKFMESISKRVGKGRIPKKRQDPPMGGGFGMEGGGPGLGIMGGGPPGLGIMGGGPPGIGSGRPGGGMGGAIGMPPGGGGAASPFFGTGGTVGAGGQNLEVSYIVGETDEEIEKLMNGRRLALTIQPQKMVVLQAAFPYRAQLEKFRLALRLPSVEELYRNHADMPVFNGVDLQRRAYGPKGDLLEDWQSIDLAGNSQPLRAVTLAYNDDPIEVRRVQLHEDHMLVMPLPKEYTGKYPEMRLASLKAASEKVKKQDPRLVTAPAPKGRFTGGESPFSRGSTPSAGLFNPPGGGGEGGMFLPPGGRMPPGVKGPGETGAPVETGKYEPPDFIHVRVYDTDIKDGLTYEYRARVKVKNPNFKKHDLVSKASDADVEELPPLEEHWFVFAQKVKVPQAGYFYVLDPLPPNTKSIKPLPTPDKEKGQAVVQFQQWIDYLNINEKLQEPVGDWVQSELIATRGQFVYGKAFAPVPFWSPTENAFVMREITGEAVPKGKEPRRGVELFPVRPRSLLAVDVAGGKPTLAASRVPPNVGEKTNRGGTVDDISAAEVLFLLPDGTLEVHSSAKDKADAERKEREEAFKKWVEDTEKKNPTGPAQKKGAGGIEF